VFKRTSKQLPYPPIPGVRRVKKLGLYFYLIIYHQLEDALALLEELSVSCVEPSLHYQSQDAQFWLIPSHDLQQWEVFWSSAYYYKLSIQGIIFIWPAHRMEQEPLLQWHQRHKILEPLKYVIPLYWVFTHLGKLPCAENFMRLSKPHTALFGLEIPAIYVSDASGLLELFDRQFSQLVGRVQAHVLAILYHTAATSAFFFAFRNLGKNLMHWINVGHKRLLQGGYFSLKAVYFCDIEGEAGLQCMTNILEKKVHHTVDRKKQASRSYDRALCIGLLAISLTLTLTMTWVKQYGEAMNTIRHVDHFFMQTIHPIKGSASPESLLMTTRLLIQLNQKLVFPWMTYVSPAMHRLKQTTITLEDMYRERMIASMLQRALTDAVQQHSPITYGLYELYASLAQANRHPLSLQSWLRTTVAHDITLVTWKGLIMPDVHVLTLARHYLKQASSDHLAHGALWLESLTWPLSHGISSAFTVQAVPAMLKVRLPYWHKHMLKQHRHVSFGTLSKVYFQMYLVTWQKKASHMGWMTHHAVTKITSLKYLLHTFIQHPELDQQLRELLSQTNVLDQYHLPTPVRVEFQHLQTFLEDKESLLKDLILILEDYCTDIQQSNHPEYLAFKLLKTHHMVEAQGASDVLTQLTLMANTAPEPFYSQLHHLLEQVFDFLSELSARWINHVYQTELLSDFNATLANRYPFQATATEDAAIHDVQRWFGPGGTWENFFKNYISVLPSSSAFINHHAVNSIQALSTHWFTMSDNPSCTVTILPVLLLPGLDNIYIQINEEAVHFSMPLTAHTFHYPLANDNEVVISLHGPDQTPVRVQAHGAFALMHALDAIGFFMGTDDRAHQSSVLWHFKKNAYDGQVMITSPIQMLLRQNGLQLPTSILS
jgi:hypothetical protein